MEIDNSCKEQVPEKERTDRPNPILLQHVTATGHRYGTVAVLFVMMSARPGWGVADDVSAKREGITPQ